MSERSERVKKRSAYYRQAGLKSASDVTAERKKQEEEREKARQAQEEQRRAQMTPAERYAQSKTATAAKEYAAESGNRWSSDAYKKKGIMPTTATSKDVGVTSSPSRQRIAKDAEDTEMLDRIIAAQDNKDYSVESAYLVDKYKKAKGYTATNPYFKEYEGDWGSEQVDKDIRERRKEVETQTFYNNWGTKYFALPDEDRNAFEVIAKNRGYYNSTIDNIKGDLKPDSRAAKKHLKGKYTDEEIDAYSRIAQDKTNYETHQKEQKAYDNVQEKLKNTDAEGKAYLSDVYAYSQSNNIVSNIFSPATLNPEDKDLAKEEGNEKDRLEKNKNTAVKALKDKYGYTDDEITILSIYNAYEQNKISKEEEDEAIQDFVKEHPNWSWILSATTRSIAGFSGFAGYINDFENAKRLEKAGYEGKIMAQGADNPFNVYANFNSAAREATADRKSYSLSLDIVNSIANGIINRIVPGLGTVNFFMDAFTDANADAVERGADIYHSGATGVVAGINEGLWETLSWGAVGAISDFTGGVIKGSNIAKRVVYFLAQRLADAGVNGVEELNTEAFNILGDYLINGDYSQYGIMAKSLLEQGYSKKEVEAAVAYQIGDQLYQNFEGGFLQGAIMGGGRQIVTSAANAYQNNQLGMGMRLGKNYSVEAMTQQISNEINSQGYESENSAEALAEGIAKLATGGKANSSVQAEINQSEFLTSLLNDATAAVQNNTDVINSSAQEIGITPQGDSNRSVANTARLVKAKVDRGMEVGRADLYNQFREQGASGLQSAVQAYKANKLNKKLSNYEYNNLTRQEREDAINRGELSQAITQAKEKKASENKSDLASFAKIRDVIGGAEETRQRISNTGETTLSDSGEAVKNYKVSNIERIADNKTGEYADVKIEVTLDNGKTKIVSPTDIDYSNNAQAKAIDVLATVATATDIDTETANFILNSVPLISQNYSERTIATAIRTAYDYGKYNLPIGTYGQTSVGILGEDLFNSIKKYGAEALESETAELTKSIVAATALNKGKTGKATFKGKELSYESIDNDNSLNKTQKDELKHAVFIAEVTGLEVEAFESTEEERKAGKENGYFNGNVLAIDINAGTEGKLMFTLAHELTHFIKQWSPEQFNNLAKFVMDKYGQQGIDVEGLIESKIRNAKKRKLSRAAAYEEVVCDAMESMLTDDRKTVIKNLAELNRDNPELFNKLNGEIERIGDNVSKKYNEFIKSNKEISREGKYIANAKEDIDELRKMFAEALQEAGENYRKAGAVEEGTKYQLRDIPSDDEIEKNFTNVASMEPVAKMTGDEFAKGETDLVTQVSNYFDSIGNIVATKHGDIILNREGVRDSLGHGMGRAKAIAYKAVPQVLREGKILSFTKNYKGQKTDRAVFFAPIKIRNDEYFEAVIVTAGLNDNHFYLHEVMAIRKDGKSPFKTGSKTSGEMSSIYNILQRLVNVKTESKFQDREPIEETKNLLAIHNTTEEKLFASLKMGGFPMPSIAIVKDTMGHDKFGGISVVFGKDTIDPALPNNKVYGSDAYTPTRISVEHKVNSKAINSIHDKVKEMIEREGISYNDLPYSGLDSQNAEDKLNRNQGDIYDAYGTTDALKIAYASEKGIPFIKQYFEKQINPRLDNEIVKMLMSDSAFMERIKEYISNDEYIDPNNISEDTVYDLLKFINKACQEYYQLDNDELYTYNRFGKYETSEMLSSIRRITQEGIPRTFDNRTAVDSINEVISKDDRKDYKNWLNELFEGVVEKKGIRNKTDLFTPSGKRRSFEQLHWEYTLENIVRAMKSQDFQKGQTFGGVSITGSATRNFKSLKEIKENSSKLNLETEKEFNDKQREFGDRFHNLAYEFAGNGDYRSADGCEEVMVEAINKYSNLNLDSIKAYLKRESQGWANYKDSIAEELVKLVKDIRDMPTGYFEAKPQRAVGLGEIKAVVVPSNVSPRLKTWLSNRGINNIVEYDAGDEKDRLAKLNSIEDVKFQERNDSAIDDEYSYVLEKYGEDSWQVADIINKAAVRAGYNSPKLWHGTNKFGFTWFDLNRMDDKQSIFLTSSPIMASSYSGKTGTRKISSYDRRDISKLHGKELVDKANEAFREAGVAFAPFKYYSKKELRQKLENYAKLEKETISILEKGVKEKTELINQIGAGAYSSDMLNKIAHVEAGIEYLKNHNAAKARQELNAFASYVVSDFEQNRTVLENVFELKQLDDIYLKSENLTEDGGAIFHLGVFASEEEARENAYKAPAEGNYQLKAKLGKSLIVDAEGANWNKVPFNLNQLGDISNYDYYQAGDRFVLVNAETGELLEGRSYTADTDKWLYSPSVEKLKEIYREAGEWNHDSILKALYTMAKDEDERLEIFNTARTRDIADWAKRNGYDSVVFQNLYDDGGRGNGQPIPMADVYVIFDPNSVKSLDPVTYDDDGNVIPPSQRFNEEEKDFRYQERYSAEEMWKHKDLQQALLKTANRAADFTILSFDEVMADANYYPYDFTREKAELAEENGKLTIYSTEPIETGVRIYTSKEDAKDYAGGGKVYEKVVSPFDVAWDTIEGGVYAEVDSDIDNFILEKLLNISYNDYIRERDRWEAKGKVPKGTRRIMYNPYNGKFEVWERGDDALLKYVSTKDFKEAKSVYEQGYSRAREELLQELNQAEYSEGQMLTNSALRGGLGYDAEDNGRIRENEETESIRSRADSAGRNNESALQRRITDSERSIGNDGALSDAKLQEREAPEERELPYFLDKQEQDEVFAILEEMNRARDEIFNGAEVVPENRIGGVRVLNKGQRQRIKKEAVYQLVRKYKKKFADKGHPFSLENVDKITDMLQKLYEDMQNDNNIAWEEAYERAREIAIEVVKYTNWRTVYDRHYKDATKEALFSNAHKERGENPYGMLGRAQDEQGNDIWNDELGAYEERFELYDPDSIIPIINEILTDYFDIPVSNSAAVQKASVKANYENKIGELKRQLKDLEKEHKELVKDKTKAERRVIIEQRRNERYHETVEKRNQKAQIKKVADSIIKKLTTNGDQSTKHIPEELKKSIIEFANLINDSGAFDSRKSERLQSSLFKLSEALEKNNDDSEDGDANMMSMYDDELRRAVNALAKNIDNRRLTDLTSAELKEIKDITRYIRHIIVTANKAFSSNIKEGIDEMGASANMEIRSQGKSRIFATKVQTGMIKPVYFFDMLGSPTLSRLYENIRNGELEWYRVIDKAKDFRAETQKKYNYDDWKDDTVTVKLSSGDIELTIEEALSLYATIKRSNGQGANHLMQGGFSTENLVLGKDKGLIGRTKDAVERTVKKKTQNTEENLERTKRRISADEMTAFVQSLTTEQREYADALVGYMSNDMASLGNEITMKLYGIRKFLEDYYFPISSDPNSLFDDGGGSMGNVDNRIKHLSMTKSLTNKANNPLIIGDFTETCMRHCSDMGLYYGFCLPMEDFNRVYNYKGVMPKKDSGTDKLQVNIKDAIRDTFVTSDNGNSRTKNNAIDYISNLRRDINGKAGRDAGGQLVAKMVSLAKKNAVFGSMSVAIQQPSAIARALRYINPKYFAKTTFTKRDYDECKKYCAVAGIKEMGFFDVGVGRNATEYMLQGEYKGLKAKGKALLNDKGYRDEALSKLPSVMDEVTWAHIWNACKAEIKDTTDLEEGTDEFYEAAAKRFTYVIDRTQVYDSVFSRSQFMRSKDTGAQVATAFMAEPTTALNMLYSGAFGKLQNGETRRQAAGKSIAAFLAAVALNSLLKSIVTAARHAGKDDNEDKSWWEIYLNEFFSNAKDDLIPLNYIPYAKDLVSLLQGYDTDRMDTQAISMIVKAYEKAIEDGFSYESVKAIASAIGVVTGVPYANVMKDIEGAKNVGERMIKTFMGEGNKTTPEGVKYAVRDAIWEPKKANQYGLLVDAYINNRPASVDKFEKDLIYHSNNGELSKTYLGDAVKKRLRSGKITRDQAVDILVRFYGYKDGGTEKTTPRYKAESKVAEWLEETD